MNAERWVTHALIMAIGFAMAYRFAGRGEPASTIKSEAVAANEMRTRAAVRPIKVQPRELLRSLATVPMESTERKNLRSEIYKEWSEKDPLGLLAHFEHRPWPLLENYHVFLNSLAKTQPEELLAYARRTGNYQALEQLAAGDPVRVLELLQHDGGRFPHYMLEEIVRKGQEMDPQFYLKLAALPDPGARKAALASAAAIMSNNRHLDDYLKFAEENPGVLTPTELGCSVGDMIRKDHRELERLDSLKPEVRDWAVYRLIDGLLDEQISDGDRREILADLAARGVLASRGETVFEQVKTSVDNSESAAEWKDWALTLPRNEQTRPLQLGVMASWAVATKAQSADFANLPQGELRDAAVLGAMDGALDAEKPEEAAKLLELIGDPSLKARMKAALERKAKGEERTGRHSPWGDRP